DDIAEDHADGNVQAVHLRLLTLQEPCQAPGRDDRPPAVGVGGADTGALDNQHTDVGAGVAPLAVGFGKPRLDLPVAGPARGVAALYLPDDAGGAGDVAGVRAAAQRPPL